MDSKSSSNHQNGVYSIEECKPFNQQAYSSEQDGVGLYGSVDRIL
jgi:hypothetical protein